MNQSPEDFGTTGSVISVKTQIKDAINDVLKKAMDKGIFDAVLIPMRVPAGDSFVYVLIKDKALLKEACFLPPIMSVQGANAVSSITRLGKGNMKIAAVMRPCELRATNELAKIDQVNVENITLVSMDCPGVMPSLDFIESPEKAMKLFDNAANCWNDDIMRPVCQICDKSSMIVGDLHIGTLGTKKDTFFLIPNSKKGKEMLDKLGIVSQDRIDSWQANVKQNAEKKQKKRKIAHKELKIQIGSLDNLLDTFSQCINCHNCMSVCPVCYCRLCYFDSDKVQHPPEDYLQRAKNKGNIRFLPDTTLFQIGRMTHMSLSCVSCGSCEDACPASIPVAQIFSMIADETQGIFDYVAGRSIEEPLPLKTYEEDELHEVEDAHD
jgi:formate dehydrogenase subunit beta